MSAETCSTHTSLGKPLDEPGDANTTQPRPRPPVREACLTPGGTHPTRGAGMIHAPNSVRKCVVPLSTMMNWPPLCLCQFDSPGISLLKLLVLGRRMADLPGSLAERVIWPELDMRWKNKDNTVERSCSTMPHRRGNPAAWRGEAQHD